MCTQSLTKSSLGPLRTDLHSSSSRPGPPVVRYVHKEEKSPRNWKATFSKMTLLSRNALLNLIPDVRWVPHDIPNGEGSERAHRSLWSRHLSGKAKAQRARDQPVQPSDVFKVGPNGFQMGRRRKSVLTLTGSHDPILDSRTNQQMQSSFFGKLPPEIRFMIYEYLFDESETIHLILGTKRKKYQHFICEESHAEDAEDDHSNTFSDCSCKILVGGRQMKRLDPGLFSFIKACRRTYSETIHHLYHPHTFSLLHAAHLLYLPSHLPLPRLNMIRKLRVRWTIRALPFLRRPGDTKHYAYREDTANWIRAWHILAHMEGLEELYVVLGELRPELTTWERSWLELEDTLLEPVKLVLRPRMFVLTLPYESCRVERDMGECRVVLRRPGMGAG